MVKEAVAEFLKAKALQPNSTLVLAALGHAYAASDKKDEAVMILRQLKRLATERYVSSGDLAIVYVGLDDKEHALNSLEAAYLDRSSWLVYLLAEPRFDNLCSDARFQDLVKRVGLKS